MCPLEGIYLNVQGSGTLCAKEQDYLTPEVAARFNEIMHIKSLAQCLALHYLVIYTVPIPLASGGRGIHGRQGDVTKEF